MVPTKDKIIEGIRCGDGNILNYLYSSVFIVVKNDILRNSGIVDDALDVFQDTLFNFYLKAKANRLNIKRNFESYLIKACHYNWLTELNKKRELRFDYDVDSYRTIESFDPGDDEDNTQYLKFKLIDKYVKSLSKTCQELINSLRNGMSEIEIIHTMCFENQASLSKKRFDCQKTLCKRIRSDSSFNEIMN